MANPASEEKLERLFSSHYAAVRAYASRRVPPAMVDEVVAGTFVVAWRRLNDVPDESRAWLLAVARNVAATESRGEFRRRSLLERLRRSHTDDSYELKTVSDSPSRITEALARLPEKDREALTLIAWDGLTPAEAAVVLGQSGAAFRVRLHRARARLRRELNGDLEAEEPAPPTASNDLIAKEGSHG